MNAESFWSMGGYGLYVWGAYGFGFVVLVGEVLQLRRRKRALHKQLRGLSKDGER